MNVVILGGTKGLGSSISKIYQKLDWDIYILGSSTPNRKTGKITYISCDLNDIKSVHTATQKLIDIKIDHFYWVSGIMIKGNFSTSSFNELNRGIDVNFKNPLPLLQTVWNSLQKNRDESKFIAISSTAGLRPKKEESIYVATKFAQVGFVKSLAAENQNPNLKISLIEPGGMKTSFWNSYSSTDISSFMDSDKVALKIYEFILNQETPFSELEIPRGSL